MTVINNQLNLWIITQITVCSLYWQTIFNAYTKGCKCLQDFFLVLCLKNLTYNNYVGRMTI